MIANMKVDFLTSRRSLFFYAIVGALWCVLMTPMLGATGAIPIALLMTGMGTLLTVSAAEATPGWTQIRAAMPSSRSQIVAGRYAFAILVLAVAAVAWTALGAITAQVLPNDASGLIGDPTPLKVLGMGSACVIALLLMYTIWLPLSFRFGATSSIQYALLALMLIPALGIALLRRSESMPKWIANLTGYLYDAQAGAFIGPHIAIAFAITAAAATVLYAVSCALSVRFFNARDL